MSTPTNGGPAFPEPFVPQSSGFTLNMHPGMSLRDWFAGQAMAALFARDDTFAYGRAEIAELAYQQADAMLAAREAK